MNPRDQIQTILSANKDLVSANLNDFWRGWAEDLIRGGIPKEEVVASMVSVAGVQAMKVFGATYMAQSFRQMADGFQLAADHGCEYPATEH